ncbi:hypothetical protein OHB49_01170 [Streptomyces sp. NBC_01717]|uniref:hypothetical protein n=1 Tax=Streptomyces sp. NBC_01717 TaxID=2975918 RepID=UPI002E341797|nr:hypothetical protein [Streptomyces sp. NBC_01717]
MTAGAVRGLADQTRLRLGGLATYLQRPPTANGAAGALEDETGIANLVFNPLVAADRIYYPSELGGEAFHGRGRVHDCFHELRGYRSFGWTGDAVCRC